MLYISKGTYAPSEAFNEMLALINQIDVECIPMYVCIFVYIFICKCLYYKNKIRGRKSASRKRNKLSVSLTYTHTYPNVKPTVMYEIIVVLTFRSHI